MRELLGCGLKPFACMQSIMRIRLGICGLEADQTANHQVRFARRCAASNRIGPAKPLPLFHGVNNNFLGILPCDQRITGSQCSTGVFSVRKLALVSPRSRGGVRCPVPARPISSSGRGRGRAGAGAQGVGTGWGHLAYLALRAGLWINS